MNWLLYDLLFLLLADAADTRWSSVPLLSSLDVVVVVAVSVVVLEDQLERKRNDHRRITRTHKHG